MGARVGNRKLALDTNLLFDLGAKRDLSHTFREVCLEKDFQLLAPPTAIQELAFAAVHKSGELQRAAKAALTSLRRWGIRPFDLLPVQYGIVDQFSRRVMLRRLLPLEEMNDSYILGETAVAEIPILVTSDHHLLDIHASDLAAVFKDSDLRAVRPTHPRLLLRAMLHK